MQILNLLLTGFSNADNNLIMLTNILNKDFSSPIDLLVYTEQYMIAMGKFHSDAASSPLYSQVSEIFANKPIGWEDQIIHLLEKKDYQYEKKLNKTLDLLDRLLPICKKETSNNIISFLHQAMTLEDVERVYQQLIFYIRRVEFGRTEQIPDLLISLLQSWQLSPSFLSWVVKDCLIDPRNEIILKLCQILRENGYELHGQIVHQELLL